MSMQKGVYNNIFSHQAAGNAPFRGIFKLCRVYLFPETQKFNHIRPTRYNRIAIIAATIELTFIRFHGK